MALKRDLEVVTHALRGWNRNKRGSEKAQAAPGVARTCQHRASFPSPRARATTSCTPRARVSKTCRAPGVPALRVEGAAARPEVTRPARGGHAAHRSTPFWGEAKENTGTVATARAGRAGAGGGPSHRPNPGLAGPYRSGSGSPPQCCGPRTRTKAPPFRGRVHLGFLLHRGLLASRSLGPAAATLAARAAATAWN